MKLTVKGLRKLIREWALEEVAPGTARSGLTRGEVYDSVEFSPDDMSFRDRWGHPIRGPEQMEPRGIRDWLDTNRVQTVTMKGKRMSPKAFMARLAPRSLARGRAIPIVKGVPEGYETHAADSSLDEAQAQKLWMVELPPGLVRDIRDVTGDMPASINLVASSASAAKTAALGALNHYTPNSRNWVMIRDIIDRYGGESMRLSIRPATVPPALMKQMHSRVERLMRAAADGDMGELHDIMDETLGWGNAAEEQWPAYQSLVGTFVHELTAAVNTASSGNDNTTVQAMDDLRAMVAGLGSQSTLN